MAQIMGNLPAERVTPSRPFSRVGLDYAGPFSIKFSKSRGSKSTKGYLAIFVCLCTKAVHLELVGDLTTASFLAALRRFIGRRGHPSAIWSDIATTFRGADAELPATLHEAQIKGNLVVNALSELGIAWYFIPPAAPHFGGLWKAVVKSAKAHLRRIIGNQLLTYEEFNTFLVQVEGTMNSRSIIPLSEDTKDLQPLTPGHFLIGTAPLNTHLPSDSDEPISYLTHWKLICAMHSQF